MKKTRDTLHTIIISHTGKEIYLDFKLAKTDIKIPKSLTRGGDIRFYCEYSAPEDILRYFADNCLPAIESVCNALESGQMTVPSINPCH